MLVISLDEGVSATVGMPRLHRERADVAFVHDKFKNQWGWNEYTAQNLDSSRTRGNQVALFCNRWNLYGRFFDEQVQSGGPCTNKVSQLQEWRENIALAVGLTSRQLHHKGRIKEQWTSEQKWTLQLTRLLRRWLGGNWQPAEAILLLPG